MQDDMVPRFLNRNSKLLIVLLAFFVVVLWLYQINIHQRLMISNTIYSIVIDAGSTGSRLHVFKLNHDDSEDKKFDIELINEELLVKVKPGLSAFGPNPEKAVDSIEPLLKRALEVIPATYHRLTRLSLKATAGLRLISDDLANKILKNIKELFMRYPFKIKGDDDVSILDGRYEGIYSWLTLNYALNSFSNSIETSVCSLDMGGGSTQVTFIPSGKVSSNEDLVKIQIDRSEYEIYAKSFLGFGLMSARLNILKKDPLNIDPTKNELFSSCFQNSSKVTWSQQGVDYIILGKNEQINNSYANCYKNVVKTLENNFDAPSDLMFKTKAGGRIDVASIKKKAMTICNTPDSSENKEVDVKDKDYAFLCMDLTFIHAILSHGYGLPDHKEIHVSNQVNGMEISWALGAAFHMLNEND
ncbi:unnamed protein product [Brachionus calyciflorus]|uniref:Ectonucleoside triphosphate diphosphohydrolase 5 n=1 Tax=Brachionus calyciflorus TaxID=104777 RepID=A0A813NH05_9BILA|nr:unnamed protein product [Brachionus calyciflorus]